MKITESPKQFMYMYLVHLTKVYSRNINMMLQLFDNEKHLPTPISAVRRKTGIQKTLTIHQHRSRSARAPLKW